ncbi:proton-coupled amino acid transporter-like protein CG1139 [Maniola jurtina]|uniref:proton-coupled amino acid transporter-like protein CG1139 n=1 Tax=Maniola jurtina TaxID=191418 RepID=UPI001E68B8A7|nr:proton-coupled amino acid transporter-like protein CG1139 [Maniola jurtina]
MANFNLLRTIFGAGTLGLPLAVSQAGIILGPIMTISLGLLIMHMHHTLLWCLHEISRQLKIPHIPYRYGFRLALLHGPDVLHRLESSAPTIVATFMILSQLGICTVFVIFTTDSLRDIMDWQTSKPAIAALLLPYLFLEYFMKSLKIVSYISMFGNFLNLIGLTLVTYHEFLGPHGKEMVYATTDSIALYFVIGTCLFNLSSLAVVLSLDRALKHPRVLTKRYGVLNFCMLTTTIFLTLFGMLGYWSFGPMEENVLRSLPFDDDSAMLAIGLYLVAVAFAYPIQCYPAIQIILDIVRNRTETLSPKILEIIEHIVRPIFVLTSFFICYMVPIQGAFVAFVGNLCTTLIALVFPALMELCLLYPNNYGKYRFYLIKDLIILVFGLSCAILGVALCGYLIYVRVLCLHSPNDDSI